MANKENRGRPQVLRRLPRKRNEETQQREVCQQRTGESHRNGAQKASRRRSKNCNPSRKPCRTEITEIKMQNKLRGRFEFRCALEVCLFSLDCYLSKRESIKR